MDSLEDSLKKLTKGAGIVLIGVFISKILAFIYRIIAARIGTKEYGLLSIGIAIFSLITTLSLLGLKTGVLRYVSFYKSKDDKRRLKGTIFSSFQLVLFPSLIFSSILFIFSKEIAFFFFHNLELALIFKVMAFFIPFAVFREVIFSISQAHHKVEYEVFSKNLLENLSKIFLILIFLVLGFKLLGLALAYSLAIFLSFLLAYFLFSKKILSPLKQILPESTYLKKRLLTFSLPLLLSLIIFSIITWIDTLMLGYFRTPSEVGIYNAALPIALFMYVIPSALLTLFIPILTEHYAKNNLVSFNGIYKRVTKWIFLANLILLSLIYLFSKPLLQILFGQNYIQGYLALIILSTGYFIGYIFSSSARVLMTIKKTKIIFVNTLTITILNIALNLYLIPLYGINGAAIATASAFFIRSLLLTIESSYFIKIIPLKLNFITILFSAALSFSLTRFLINLFSIQINPFYLILFSLLFILFYLILLILTNSFEKEDIFILDAIKKKLLGYF